MYCMYVCICHVYVPVWFLFFLIWSCSCVVWLVHSVPPVLINYLACLSSFFSLVPVSCISLNLYVCGYPFSWWFSWVWVEMKDFPLNYSCVRFSTATNCDNIFLYIYQWRSVHISCECSVYPGRLREWVCGSFNSCSLGKKL